MTLFEESNSSYSGHSSVDTQVIKAHVFPTFDSKSMKQNTDLSASETTTTSTGRGNLQQNSSYCNIKSLQNNGSSHPSSTMGQPVIATSNPLDQITKPIICTDEDVANNNSSSGPRSHTYIRFDESINNLPKNLHINNNNNSCTMKSLANLDENYIKCGKVPNGNEYPSTSTSTLSSSPNSAGGSAVNSTGHQPEESSTGSDDLMSRVLAKLRSLPCAGIILAMLSGIFFATAGFIVKLVPNVNPIEIVITRSLVQMFVYLPVIVFNQFNLMGAPGERIALFSRGFFGFLSFGLCYIAYRMIPLADASTIVFSAPVYVSVFACILLKEECGVFQAFTVIVTIAGVLLISKPTFLFGDAHEAVQVVALRMEGTVLAFISSLAAALTFVMIRKLQRTPSAVVINMFSIVSIVCGVISLSITYFVFYEEAGEFAQGIGVPETWTEIGWLFSNGMCGVLGQLCLTVALKIEEAGLVSLARTIDIVMAFLFQVVFLKSEVVHWTSVLGAVIVCIGVCVSALRRWLKSKPGKFNTLWLILNCGKERESEFRDEKCTPVPAPITGLNYTAKPASFVDVTKLVPTNSNGNSGNHVANNNYTLDSQEIVIHSGNAPSDQVSVVIDRKNAH